MPVKKRTETTSALDELRALERKPPKRANRLIVRHLKCEESLNLSYAVVHATAESSRSARRLLELPSDFLPPLV